MQEFLEYLLDLARLHKTTGSHAIIFDQLLSDPNIVKSIYSVLKPLSQSIVFRLLLVSKPVQEAVLLHWISDNLSGQAKQTILYSSLDELTLLRLLEVDNRVYIVSEVAKKTLRTLLLDSLQSTTQDTGQALEAAEAQEGFNTCWTYILQKTLDGRYISHVASAAGQAQVDQLLLGETLNFGKETAESFRFVLSPRRTQLWRLVRSQLQVVDAVQGVRALVKAVRTLARALLKVSEPMNSDKSFEDFLAALGVVDEYGRASVGASVMVGEEQKKADVMNGALIITDSNFHLTAYTTSPLQLRILALFAEVRRHLGSATAAVITRSSVWRASEAGVSAEKIIEFLEANSNQVPENVVTQLKLWEQDAISVRLSAKEAIYIAYDKIATEAAMKELGQLKDFAIAAGCLLADKLHGDKRVLVLDKNIAHQAGIF